MVSPYFALDTTNLTEFNTCQAEKFQYLIMFRKLTVPANGG